MTARGADLLIAGLEGAGVDCVFGLPGTQLVPVFEALRRHDLRVIVPTHELAAGFMALGYARSSGKPGVLLTIPGPGFAYGLTPLAEAKLDGVPLLHVTLAPTRGPDGGPGFQAVDQSSIARALVKEIVDVPDAAGVPAGVARALRLAAAAPAGPVLLQLEEGALGECAGVPATLAEGPAPVSPDWGATLAALRGARHPAIVVTADFEGAGLLEVASRWRVPVCVSAGARGAVPEDDPWAVCIDDQRTALATLNEFFGTVDLCVVLGSHLSHVATAGFELALPEASMIWVSAAAPSGGHYPRARRVTGDPAALVDAWLTFGGAPGASEWTASGLDRWRAKTRTMSLPEPRIHGVPGASAERFFDALRRSFPRDGIVVTDSGLHQSLARRHFPVFGRRGLLFPTDFQSMGFGLPAGIGARLGGRGRAVVVIVGDGGFLMSGLELLTAVKERLPIVVVVFNDGQLNLIRLQQVREYGRDHGVALPPLDYETFAAAAGVAYFAVDGDPAGVLTEALALDGPALVEVRVGDSVAMFAARAQSVARENIKRLLGPSLVKWLKGIRRR